MWLNAASSITFPTAFREKQREVKITGEVYFEVTKNSSKPFIVKTFKDEIKVLGTTFNINSYMEEGYIKTTLLEGAIEINKQILKPGQAYRNGQIVKTDVEQDIARKNGYFNFNGTDLASAMRQIGRWYNIDVNYEGKNSGQLLRKKCNVTLHYRMFWKYLKSCKLNLNFKTKPYMCNKLSLI